LIGLLAVGALSVPFGISAGSSFHFVNSFYSRVLLFVFLLLVAYRSVGDLRRFVWSYVISMAILIWFGLTSPMGATSGIDRLAIESLTYDNNDLGLVLITGIPLALITFVDSRTWGKLLSALVVAGAAAVIVRTGSRATFLASGAVVAALLVWMTAVPVRVRAGAVGVIVVSGLVAAPEGYWDHMFETVANPTGDYNWTAEQGRRDLTMRGMGYMLSRPFGVGIGNFTRAEGMISPMARERGIDGRVRWSAPHNAYVEVGAETGVLGFALWVGMVWGGAIFTRRLHRRVPAEWRQSRDRHHRFFFNATLFLPVAFIGFGVNAGFLSFAYMPPFYILTSYLVGVIVAGQTLGLNISGAVVRRQPKRVSSPTTSFEGVGKVTGLQGAAIDMSPVRKRQ
jgi:O-antigen ligase